MACMGQLRAKGKDAPALKLREDGLRCVARHLDAVTLELEQELSQGCLERFQHGGWLSSDGWVPVTDIELSMSDGVPRMLVSKLITETDYSFRLITDTLEAHCQCATASRPLAPKMVRTLRRRPKGLSVLVESQPEEMSLPILECELQWCGSWSSWSSKLVACEEGALVSEILLERLTSCTDYNLRARLRNAVGWSKDFTEATGRTSDIAAPPWDLKLLARRPNQVVLECEVLDPEGAPITDLEVQFSGKVTWGDVYSECSASASCWDWDDLGGGPSRKVQVTVFALPSDVVSQLRVWSKNIVGRSLTPSPTLFCQPSTRPEEVSDLHCTKRSLDFIELAWSTVDPEGAPVLECTVEFWSESAMWATVHKVQDVSKTYHQRKAFWRAKLCGLDTETSYVVRIRSRNDVGCSKDQLVVFRTAVRPVAPTSLLCGDITATTVQLCFDLSYDHAQLQCVPGLTGVVVEEAGTLAWATFPKDNVKIIEAVPDGQRLHACVQLRGLQGDTTYRFRLWPENPVGKSFSPSGALDCSTSHKPEPPRQLSATPLSANHARLFWQVPDPLGAPVHGALVEFSVQSMFGSWQPISDGFLQRVPDGWIQVVYGLDAAQEYIFRVKAQNDSGWSDWSGLFAWNTPGVPQISEILLERIHASGADKPGSSSSLVLSFTVSDPDAAPCVASTVQIGGRRVLAHRCQDTTWVALLPGGLENLTSNAACALHIEAANAVGWEQQDMQQLATSIQSPGPVLESGSLVERFSANLAETQCTLWEEELALCKGARFEEARLMKRALQVSKLREKTEVSWWTRCEDFILSFKEPKSMERLATTAVAFQLLIEGSFALEQLNVEAEGLWQNLLFLAEALPEEDGLSKWTARRDAWSVDFQEKFAFGWSHVCASVASLLAAALGKGNLMPPLRGTIQSLQRLSDIHGWVEQQIQEMRGFAEELYQVIMGSDVALSIYELHGTAAVTALTELAGLGGAFHVGVQVYWLEWSFGWCEDGSGIQAMHFGTSSLGRFRQRLPLGQTPLAPEEVLTILRDMRKSWDGQSYDLLRRNCAHFSIEFVRRLRVEEAPEWINALATTGGQMAQWLGVFRPVLVQDQDLDDLEKVVQASPAELAEWKWAHEYVKERNAEARRVRQKSTLRAAAHLKHRRVRERRPTIFF